MNRRPQILFPAAVVGAVVLAAGATRAQTWTGAVDSNWTRAANWTPASVPYSATAAASFTGAGLGTVTIAYSVQVQSITFSNPTGTYSLTAGTGAGLNVATI